MLYPCKEFVLFLISPCFSILANTGDFIFSIVFFIIIAPIITSFSHNYCTVSMSISHFFLFKWKHITSSSYPKLIELIFREGIFNLGCTFKSWWESHIQISFARISEGTGGIIISKNLLKLLKCSAMGEKHFYK